MISKAKAKRLASDVVDARIRRQHSQTQVADALGISRRTICRIEAGEQKSLTSGNIVLISHYLTCGNLAFLRSLVTHDTSA